MAYIFNPFTGTLSYYEPGLPDGGESGEILTINETADGWEWTEPTATIGSVIVSNPGENGRRITNIYVSADTGKTVVEYEDTYTTDAGEVLSQPPTGHYRATNIYADSVTGRLVVEYDDTPVT